MSKKSYVLAIALLLAVMALAACGGTGASSGGSGDTAATTEAGAAPNVPASDATVTSEAQGQPASAGSDTSGAGDTSGANATGEASSATDVGSGSDGAAGSGGSNAASGATSPESDTGAPAAGDDTGNAASGTGGTTDASGNTTDSGGNAGGEGETGQGTASGAEGGTAGGAATGTGDNNAQVQTPAASYTAVSDAECTDVQGQLSQALGVEVNRGTGVASFSDLSGGTGESCQLTVTGTGAQFTNMVDTAALIRQTLSDNGWTVDEQYAADSPTGTMGGLRRDNQLAAYSVQWQPGAGVTCPADQPISACAETLTPEQMDYRITVDLAQQ